jgi:hypothetical protein
MIFIADCINNWPLAILISSDKNLLVDADLNKFWLQFWSNTRKIGVNRGVFAAKTVHF